MTRERMEWLQREVREGFGLTESERDELRALEARFDRPRSLWIGTLAEFRALDLGSPTSDAGVRS